MIKTLSLMKVVLKSIYENWEKWDLEELESSSFCKWFICSVLAIFPIIMLQLQELELFFKKENFKSHQTSWGFK